MEFIYNNSKYTFSVWLKQNIKNLLINVTYRLILLIFIGIMIVSFENEWLVLIHLIKDFFNLIYG